MVFIKTDVHCDLNLIMHCTTSTFCTYLVYALYKACIVFYPCATCANVYIFHVLCTVIKYIKTLSLASVVFYTHYITLHLLFNFTNIVIRAYSAVKHIAVCQFITIYLLNILFARNIV